MFSPTLSVLRLFPAPLMGEFILLPPISLSVVSSDLHSWKFPVGQAGHSLGSRFDPGHVDRVCQAQKRRWT